MVEEQEIPAAMPVSAEDEAPDAALRQARDHKARQLARLGITNWTDDIKTDNTVLVASLAKIQAAGAPKPVITREAAWTPTGMWDIDVYVYTHWQNPRLQLRCTEAYLALNPDVVINELKTAGISRQL